ncbi:MAG: hypothetical protein HC809_12990 [Gammaproteobacteria bacterium]|nr:hypothetical protein [Gammaproteobacteria bacterium]
MKSEFRRWVRVAAAFATASVIQSADAAGEPRFGIDQAESLMAAAVEYARAHEAPGGTIAIVDGGGHLLLLKRLDHTFTASAPVAEGKARTSVLFQKPTRVFEDLVNQGRTTMVTVAAVTGFTPLKGGVPIVIGGEIVGGIGVSGAKSADQDDEIAQAAVDAFGAQRVVDAAVTRLPSAQVQQAFKTGETLFVADGFRVNASRRDAPGESEVHLEDADIFYVLEGSARFVTGGEMLEPREVAPGEIRGVGITAGKASRISAGDVVVVPAGVPHWFESVRAPFLYYVVKASRS